ncbi:MAG: FAD-dependent oxidoreductase [Thermodesulfobacteriota bacterium]
MKKPIIFAIDDDPQVIRAIERDLRKSYSRDYRILSSVSGKKALENVKQLKLKNENVAMFVSDQRMPEVSGVDFLFEAKQSFPEAKSILLTAYSDTDAAIKAINDVALDYYLMKPWDPPEERLYPILDDLLDDWQAGFRPDFEGIKVLGYQWSPKSYAIKDFLAGNLIPYQWLDIENNNKAKDILTTSQIDPKETPVVFFEDGTHIIQPDILSIARKVGLKSEVSDKIYDVVIIGAGPAGLAASVYGASEGLKTLLIERKAPGGQAGTSSRIENYLGFPSGLSGSDLTRRAVAQATRMGAEMLSPLEAVDIKLKDKYKTVVLSDGSEINTLSVIIATGVSYRKLDKKGINDFTGAGIYYGSASTEAHACRGKDVYIVGGGNSAGQAAMYLSNFAKKVYIVIRAESLFKSMSKYLIDQIDNTDNISVITKTEITEAKGERNLKELVLKNQKENKPYKADSLFIFIGTKPFTDWLKLDIIKNERGFIETGRDLTRYDEFKKIWKLDREPFLLETCAPGIFAVGDVRAGAMKRVASAVGEGSMAIKFVHEYLSEL